MNATQIIEEIFQKRTVTDSQGREYKLESNVDAAEGAFLSGIIRQHKPRNSIEVGCAYGISSLFICDAMETTTGGKHTIIDPCQTEFFNSIGIHHLQKAGCTNYEFIEDLSELVLPRLLAEGKKFDFAFIDGMHTFDHTLIDFFYLNRMMNIGGIIVIDDTGMPSISKLMRYLLNYPAYQPAGAVTFKYSAKKELFELLVKSPLRLVSKLLPEKLKYDVFSSAVITSDKRRGLNASMIALQKVKEDERSWNWFKEF